VSIIQILNFYKPYNQWWNWIKSW